MPKSNCELFHGNSHKSLNFGGETLFVKLYLVALPIFFILDLIWITLAAKDLFQKQVGSLMKPDVNWIAAFILYMLLVTGLVLLVIIPSIEKNSWRHAALYGALFGLVTYATYDLTNLAILKNWPLGMALIDLAWGTVLALLVSLITFFIGRVLLS